MTVEQLLAGVESRLDTLENAVRATPRVGPVLLSDGSRVGHARKLRPSEWNRVRADWSAQYPTTDPVVKPEAEAAA